MSAEVPEGFSLGVYTDAGELGGAEMAIANLLERLRPSVSVTVLGPHEDVVRWIAARRAHSRYAVLPGLQDRDRVTALWRTRQAFVRLGADVLHFNLSCMSSCQWAIVAAMTIPSQRFVVMEHSPVGAWSSRSRRLKRITSRRADAHVTVGRAAATMIERLGDLPAGSLEVVYSGVPLRELHPPPRTSDDFTIGMLSRHDPVKGIDLAIEVVARLGEGYRLVVVGDGPQRPELEALVRRLGMSERVELLPFRADARDLLGIFDVYLLPSRLEAFPVTVQEAMQAGVPVVATEVGSVREAIDEGETGFVVPVGDVGAMADAIRHLAGDDDLRARMGQLAAEVGRQRFDVDAGAAGWEAVYDRVRPR
jgi:glycosyltransferase involved in cell wall biosynthesis